MAVVIGQIVTEAVVAPQSDGTAATAGEPSRDDAHMDLIVRRATERVLEILRREWDR